MTKEERKMASEIDEAVQRLRELNPLSIILTGSFARGEWHEKSDAEVILVFEDERYQSRTKVKPHATERVRLYPFRRSEFVAAASVVPFPTKFYFWWIKKTAKTLWGQDLLGDIKVEMRLEDWHETIAYHRGTATAAFISFRNGDIETAGWGFSKSCLFATVSGLALKGVEVFSFGEAVRRAKTESPEFAWLVERANAVWSGGAEPEERDIFQNFEYLHMLNRL